VLAEPVVARHDLPRFDNAAMDGYAVRAADVEAAGVGEDDAGQGAASILLRVVGDVAAGSHDDPPLGDGEAVRIMTGAPLPSGADAVVPLEHTVEGTAFPADGVVHVMRPAQRGAHVRGVGEEARQGAAVIAAGRVLGPHQLAAAAAAGNAELVVHRAPRIAVLATGSELVAPGHDLARGQISESNSTLLAGLAGSAGGTVLTAGVVGDEPDALHAALGEVQASVDAIVITGGVGAGAYDVVRRTLATVLDFHDVAMQPGRPQAFGRLPGGPIVFGLPGNPVAAAVSFEVFVRPALSRLRGVRGERRTFEGVATAGWRSRGDRAQYLPVIVDGDRVRPAGAARSHFVASLARADAYAVVPVGITEVRAGDRVTVLEATGPQ